ncbi:M43 family zinc metalloprotease [Xanthovirga aplysinae]|uniref:M43 family zinc metalloprotease n=1 Tax=Xanthovirga aplysinae TaxID=2529853 RepID=UPI0012BB9897|nr:M43 family zinc metalloprotease [Xanthovirga aplysinae]MTI30950.1 T9SS type A sorting domain-containing protein [Xanthovirga aplysinae]
MMKNLLNKRVLKLSLFLIALLSFKVSLYAQEPVKCLQNENRRIDHALSQEAIEKVQIAEKKAKEIRSRLSPSSSRLSQSDIVQSSHTQYTVPVVFHVFGDFSWGTVDDQRIITALEKVNEDFQGLNPDFDDVITQFRSIRGTLDISFELAQYDPEGNSTTGIIYHPKETNLAEDWEKMQVYAWDNYQYMNVYILEELYDDGVLNYSGIAWLPSTNESNQNIAGIVYNGNYLYGNTDDEFAATLTHEFGHFLGLYHTFGPSNPAEDCDDDGVLDTPITNANDGVCTDVGGCFGETPNYSNYMDYSSCRRMFTQGQVARMEGEEYGLLHDARITLWQEENLIKTGIIEAPLLTFSGSEFIESTANNGSFDETKTIRALGGAQFATSGTLSENTHYTTSGVPSGLSVQITVNNSSEATLTLTGSTNSHGDNADVSNLNIAFLNAAVQGSAANIINSSMDFSVDFRAPYEVVYENIADITVDNGYTWEYFELEVGNVELEVGNFDFGVWYDDGDLRFETYQKSLICEGNTRNITLLNDGDPIEASSNWVAGGAWPDEHDIRTPSYTDWDGEEGFIGFQVNNVYGETLHGWFRISVAANGNSYTLRDYAYSTQPEGTILAGSTDFPTDNLPVANFSVSASTIDVGETVSFTNQSTDATTYSWSFPGGSPSSSNQRNPTVTFNTAGTFEVTLTASNADGSDQATTSITVLGDDSDIYCASNSSTNQYEWIANVESGSFQNSTGASGYSDFTNQTINLSLNESNEIIVTPGFASSSYTEHLRIWIDYNNSSSFESGELVFQGSGSGAITANFTPTNAGTTRMRISLKYGSAADVCEEDFNGGEVEDYTVNISGDVIINPPGDYCASNGNNDNSEWIGNVTVGDLNYSSSNSGDRSGYSDFTSQRANLSAGSGVNVRLTPDFSSSSEWNESFRIWIDYNQDGDFEDAQEQTFEGTYTANSSVSVTGSFTVPSSALSGATRMRVSMNGDAFSAPCGTFSYGEVEDYTVNISNGLAGAAGPSTSNNQSENVSLASDINIYPNPAPNGKFSVEFSNELKSTTTLSILDVTGKLLYSKSIELKPGANKEQIDISNLPKGLYYLVINGSNGVNTQKVIVE